MRIASVGVALPRHFYDQETILDRFERVWAGRHYNLERLRRLHANVLVGGRHLALPIDDYERLQSFGDANDAWIEVGLDVGARALEDALERAGCAAADLGALFFVTVTGLAVPSLDARLMNRLDLPTNLRRVPIFGLGCVAGAAGISRAADYVKAYPDQLAVLLSVELCSLTLQREDLSVPNLIASGLFGDGAAAVLVAGAEHPLCRSAERPVGRGNAGPEVLASRSAFYPNTEEVMGWRISERGFGVVLSADVPRMVELHLKRDVERFLADQGVAPSELKSWVCHPGGPKVLEAMQRALELPEGALELTWKSLREVGNLSSTSVLMVLRDTLDQQRPPAGSLGLLLAMGPGFCSELVLLRW